MDTNTVGAIPQVATHQPVLDFKVNRYDNLRVYTPEEVVASFESVNAKMANFKSSIKYVPASEEYKAAMNFKGEVFTGILKAKTQTNFHSSNYEELQLRDKDDILQFVEDTANEILTPDNDTIRSKKPNTITKWYWNAADRILHLQTARLKESASDLMLNSERSYVERALDTITSLVSA